jgi:hypothetical protein
MRYKLRPAIAAMAALSLLLLCNRAGFADDAATVRVKYASGETELGTLQEGAKYFSNRGYTIEHLPDEMAGLVFTRRAGGAPAAVHLRVPSGTTVYLLIGTGGNPELPDSNWNRFVTANYTDRVHSQLTVYKRAFSDEAELDFPRSSWPGTVVAAKNLALDTGDNNGGKKPDEPADATEPATTLHTDPSPDTTPLLGPTTRASTAQSSINALEIYESEHGMMLGQTSEATLTFEDKYVAHDGGSIGTAIGTMILSCIQGFTIDPSVAITGDISVNGKVRAIGGVSAKIKGATASKCTLVAIPNDNLDQLTDAVLYNGPQMATDIQVIGIGNLQDAVATVRTDRDPKLTQAIALFSETQKTLKLSPAAIKTKPVQAQLQKVLALAPQHLSAQVLLATGTQPKTLSATASQYYLPRRRQHGGCAQSPR